MRNWMGVSERVSKQDLEKIDQSIHKGSEIDIEKVIISKNNDFMILGEERVPRRS